MDPVLVLFKRLSFMPPDDPSEKLTGLEGEEGDAAHEPADILIGVIELFQDGDAVWLGVGAHEPADWLIGVPALVIGVFHILNDGLRGVGAQEPADVFIGVADMAGVADTEGESPAWGVLNVDSNSAEKERFLLIDGVELLVAGEDVLKQFSETFNC